MSTQPKPSELLKTTLNAPAGAETEGQLSPGRLARAKQAYTTRYVDIERATGLLDHAIPCIGDVVLARVEELGQHLKIERTDGRRATMFPGDELIVAYGHRYAPDQFEAMVPDDLGPCDLAAAGGIASRVVNAHGKMLPATTLVPLGLLIDADGARLNLKDGNLVGASVYPTGRRPVTFAVAGASMNAGKTTTAAHLVRGLAAAGLSVGAAKVTGTGAGGDVWLLTDAGASPVYDFTTAGVPSTYMIGLTEVLRVFSELTDRLAADGCEAIVLEVADGVFQQETSQLLQDDLFAERVDAVVFAASDALGASAGIEWMDSRMLGPLALSGVLSSSPLATREAEAATGREVWGLERLSEPLTARALYEDLLAGRPVRGTVGVEDPDPATEFKLAEPGLSKAV
jgi:molybdopterin-guanine dinucleotide biosynthesis protein